MVKDEIRQILRQFIIDNPQCTIGAAVRHMSTLAEKSYRLSRTTTVKLIYEFERSNIISIGKPERKGQGYRLLINEDNSFNFIDRWIGETEIVGKIVQRNLDKIFDLYNKFTLDSEEGKELEELLRLNPEHKELEELLRHFDEAKDVIKMMIHILLIEIYKGITSNDDRLTLTLKTINLIVKTMKHTLLPRPPLTLSEYFRLSNSSLSGSAKEYGKNVGIQIEYLPYLAEKFDDFDKRFLSPYINRGSHHS